MIKYLVILFNSLLVFFYGIFSAQDGIKVTGNIPSTFEAGKDVEIELKVEKGGMGGFAKLQLDLPEGFTIKMAEEKGASYSFEAGIAKWIWAALPADNEIVVRLTVVAPESAIGQKFITAKYSYVENNVKQMVEMNPAEINVVAPGSNVVTSAEQPKPDTTAAVATDTTQTAQTLAVSNNEPPGNIKVVRKIEAGGTGNEWVVNIEIQKGLTRGFARFSDDLPDDVIVKNAKTDGASFSVSDGKIKFVWVNVPEKELLEISYTISSLKTQTVDLKGEYSYLEDNQSKKIKTDPQVLSFEIPVVAVVGEPKTEPPVSEPANTVQTTEPTPNATKNTETESLASGERNPTSSSAVLEKKEPDMIYLVQVGAFSKKKVTVKRMEKKFKITEPIRTEMAEGFSKFMVGSHAEYKEARDHRENVISVNKIKSAFVVAYNHGKRITVQEALMISNQKWFR
jgi:hypothetical protein